MSKNEPNSPFKSAGIKPFKLEKNNSQNYKKFGKPVDTILW
jgi:hypothetical protein